MTTTYDKHFLQSIESVLVLNGELPEISLKYSRHAEQRFLQRHKDIAERPETIKITKDNLLVLQEGDSPEEVIIKVGVPIKTVDDSLPTYYLGFVIALRESKKGEIKNGTVITTFPYDRAQYLSKALGRARRAERSGKLSFRTKRKRRKRK